MNDPFERLPAEILLIIIKLVPDSSSLLHLVQASIFVADIFGNYPSEAVGTLISRLPEELQPIRDNSSCYCDPFSSDDRTQPHYGSGGRP
jgi:hypothetical protein